VIPNVRVIKKILNIEPRAWVLRVIGGSPFLGSVNEDGGIFRGVLVIRFEE
jgi:hypothetical protein